MSLWTLDSGAVTLDSGVFTWDGFGPDVPRAFGGPIRWKKWKEEEPAKETKGPEPAEITAQIHFGSLKPLPDYSADRPRIDKAIKAAEEDELMQVLLLLED